MFAGKKALLFSMMMATVCLVLVVTCSLAWFTTKDQKNVDVSEFQSGEITDISLGTITTAEEQISYEGQTGLAFYDYVIENDSVKDSYMIEDVPFTIDIWLHADTTTLIDPEHPELGTYTGGGFGTNAFRVLYTDGSYLVRDDREEDLFIIYSSLAMDFVLARSTIATIEVDEITYATHITGHYRINRMALKNEDEVGSSVRFYLPDERHIRADFRLYNAGDHGEITPSTYIENSYVATNQDSVTRKIYYSGDVGNTVSLATPEQIADVSKLYVVIPTGFCDERGTLLYSSEGVDVNCQIVFDLEAPIKQISRIFDVTVTEIRTYAEMTPIAISDKTERAIYNTDGSITVINLEDPENPQYYVYTGRYFAAQRLVYHSSDGGITLTEATKQQVDLGRSLYVIVDGINTVYTSSHGAITPELFYPNDINEVDTNNNGTDLAGKPAMVVTQTVSENVDFAINESGATPITSYTTNTTVTTSVTAIYTASSNIPSVGFRQVTFNNGMVAKLYTSSLHQGKIDVFQGSITSNCIYSNDATERPEQVATITADGDYNLTIEYSTTETTTQQNIRTGANTSGNGSILRTIRLDNGGRLVIDMTTEDYVYTLYDADGSVNENSVMEYSVLTVTETEGLPLIKLKYVQQRYPFQGMISTVNAQNETTITNLNNEIINNTTTTIKYPAFDTILHGDIFLRPVTAKTSENYIIYYSEDSGETLVEATHEQILEGVNLYVIVVLSYNSATHGAVLNKTTLDFDIRYYDYANDLESNATMQQIRDCTSPWQSFDANLFGAIDVPELYTTEQNFALYYSADGITFTPATLEQLSNGAYIYVTVEEAYALYDASTYGRFQAKTIDGFVLYYDDGGMSRQFATANQVYNNDHLCCYAPSLFVYEEQEYDSDTHGVLSNCITNRGHTILYRQEGATTFNPASVVQVARGYNLYVIVDGENYQYNEDVYAEFGEYIGITQTGNTILHRNSVGILEIASVTEVARGVDLFCSIKTVYNSSVHGEFYAITEQNIPIYYSTNSGETSSAANVNQIIAGLLLYVFLPAPYVPETHGTQYQIFYSEDQEEYSIATANQLFLGDCLYIFIDEQYVGYNPLEHGLIMYSTYTTSGNRLYFGNNYKFTYATQAQIRTSVEEHTYPLYVKDSSLLNRQNNVLFSSTSAMFDVDTYPDTVLTYAVYNSSVLDTAYYGIKTFDLQLDVLFGEVYTLNIIANKIILTPTHSVPYLEGLAEDGIIETLPVYYTYVTVTQEGEDTISKKHFGLSARVQGYGIGGFYEITTISNYDQTRTEVTRHFEGYSQGLHGSYVIATAKGYDLYYSEDSGATLTQVTRAQAEAATASQNYSNLYVVINEIPIQYSPMTHGYYVCSVPPTTKVSTTSNYDAFYSEDNGFTLLKLTTEQAEQAFAANDYTNIYVKVAGQKIAYEPATHGTFVYLPVAAKILHYYDNLALNSSNQFSPATFEQLDAGMQIFVPTTSEATLYDKYGAVMYSSGTSGDTTTAISYQIGTAYEMNNYTFIDDFHWEMILVNDTTGEELVFYPDSEGYLSSEPMSTYTNDRFAVSQVGSYSYSCTLRLYFVSTYTYTNLDNTDRVTYQYNMRNARYQVYNTGNLQPFAYSDLSYMGTNFIISLALGINVAQAS